MDYKEAVIRLFGAKEEKMSVVHDGTRPLDELLDLALRTKDALRKKLKKGKPGPRLNFIHTGMLGADRKLRKGAYKQVVKRDREILKKIKRDSHLTIKELRREIKELEKKLRG